MKAIFWQERYTCNYNCPYCLDVKRDNGGALPLWSEWVEVLNKFNPEILDITGGEPFLNPNLVDIINGLKPKIGLTTNLTKDITRFGSEVSPQKVVSMTLSYHPSMLLNKDIFLGRCIYLINKGFNITVNVVAYPPQMYLIPELKKLFEGIAARFHVDSYRIIGGHYAYSEVEKQFLAPYIGADRAFSMKEEVNKVVHCSAGRDYLNIDPIGDVYRCRAHHLKGEKPFGNVFKDFKFLENDLCHINGECGGCDRDKVTIY